MMYPISILQSIIPNITISTSSFLEFSTMIVHSDSVQIDIGYDNEKDDLIWEDISYKMWTCKMFLDLIFNAEEIYVSS